MRFVVYGVGAIGGVVSAALMSSGQQVVGIARGRRGQAINATGLTLRSPSGVQTVPLKCFAAASELGLGDKDVVLLAVKGQDTIGALQDLRAAGCNEQHIFCLQNGVANERTALRYFANVHAVNVMMPAEYMKPDEAIAFCGPNFGVFDIGRFPEGTDDMDVAVANALTEAKVLSQATPVAMEFKYGKLLLNLGNIVEAALGRDVDSADLSEHLRNEGRMVLRQAGISWREVGADEPRRQTMQQGEVEGAGRIGSSSTQSLARGTGSIETDYLNGEIVLLGRLNGIETPANRFATRLAARLARDRQPPGAVSRDEFARGIGFTV